MKFRSYFPGTVVRVTKVSAVDDPETLPGSWDTWNPGSLHNVGSLPVDYEVRGVLLGPVREGLPLVVLRTHRNGVAREGRFVSTPVVKVRADGLVETANSIYRIAFLKPKKRGNPHEAPVAD